MKYHITIIDDEHVICKSLSFALEKDYDVDTFTDAEAGLKFLEDGSCDLVLLDLRIGEYDGIEVLKRIKKIDKSIAVIMMTAYASIKSSVDAMKSGAFTYLTKPIDIEELIIVVNHALEFKQLSKHVDYLNSELAGRYKYGDLIGQTHAMQHIYEQIEIFKDTDASICVTGESGTGKELVARAIHFLGRRKTGIFMAINCTAIPEGLMEGEFFGYKKGSYTGAVADKKGKLEIADKGTLFLDEIGDMPYSMQGKLLRVLQQKEFTPIGGVQPKRIDVRLIVATNKNLEEMVRAGTFRQDFFYRLNVVPIHIPPLRERQKDIPILCDFFVRKYADEQAKRIAGVTKEAEEFLLRYPFPGNVRELANALEYATIVCKGNAVDVDHLPEYILNPKKKSITNDSRNNNFIGKTLREIERIIIVDCLERHGGHQRKSADELGISERGLRNKIKEYGI